MATKTKTEPLKTQVLVQWANLLTGETGDAEDFGSYRVFSIDAQAAGTFGGATVTIEGSLDGASWFPLTSPGGAGAALTAPGLIGIVEVPKFVRPVSAGGASSDVTVHVLARAVS